MRHQQERITGAIGPQGRHSPVMHGRVVPQGQAEERMPSAGATRVRRSHRDGGGGRAARRPGVGAIAVLLLGPLALGAGVDALVGREPGWGVAVGATAGALLAAVAAVRCRSLGLVAPLPVLAVAVVTAGAMLTSHGPLVTRLVRWAVAVFPAMAAAECAIAVVALAAAGLRFGMTRRGRA
ncbi:hypothetical protein [Streptomyces roseochromogenus]|uniref:Uncharacterized protein n=1 Tax=Streptomyces roseochromogenus subsp. oscitans DS 12.976 TaxID=1352936 RepID=V6JHC5_STRRC|nr:hypothetical protein [Streptomyces roseochromogenus]EST19123.1 hypothetical protein M878_43435 [Streptomyces roseochromogenus subsp. oscitans DS 12.976]